MSRARIDKVNELSSELIHFRATRQEKLVLKQLARKLNVTRSAVIRTLIAREAAAQGVTLEKETSTHETDE